MKNFSISRLAETILARRKLLKLTQQQLADQAGINRSMLCKLENQEYVPSLDQLTRLANTLGFDVADVFIEYTPPVFHRITPRKIAVYGASPAGLAAATLLARQHQVTLADSSDEMVGQINQRTGRYEDEYIEKYFMSANLHLTATTDEDAACKNADFTVIAVPTGYHTQTNHFDVSAVESTIETILDSNPKTTIIIRSSVPVGFTAEARRKFHTENILCAPDCARETHALYDNLYPARIVIGCDEANKEKAQEFAGILKNSALKKDVEVLMTGPDEAESIRIFSDAFLAVRRSCINELDSFAEARNLNTKEIIQGVCLDPRIGDHDNTPSFGDARRGLPENIGQVMAEAERLPHIMLGAVTESNRIRLDHIADGILRKAGINPEKEEQIISGKRQLTAGIYRPAGKNNADPNRNKVIQEIMRRLRARGIGFVVYEPLLEDGSIFYGGKVINHLKRFKKHSDIIVADMYHPSLNDVREKVYTRDLPADEAKDEAEW